MRSRSNSVKIDVAAQIFSALGEQTRLKIVSRLHNQGPLSIAELTEGTDVTRQAITKHLKILESEHLVVSERHGREQIFKLETKRLQIAIGFLELISEQWDERLDRLKNLVEK